MIRAQGGRQSRAGCYMPRRDASNGFHDPDGDLSWDGPAPGPCEDPRPPWAEDPLPDPEPLLDGESVEVGGGGEGTSSPNSSSTTWRSTVRLPDSGD
jgi:hypothetical protein